MGVRTPVKIGRLIVSRPDLHEGRPCLARTGMTVHAVAARHLRGMSALDILDEFPDLDLGRIYAALAYYYANKDQIESELEAERRVGAVLAARYPHGWTRETESSLRVLSLFLNEDSMDNSLIRALRSVGLDVLTVAEVGRR